MTKIRTALWLMLLAGCLVWPFGPTLVRAQEADGGVLAGTVSNGTKGEQPQGDVEVVLRAFVGAVEQESLTVRNDEQGAFEFAGLDTGSDARYIVQTTYQGVPYVTGMISFAEGQQELIVDVVVYETTSDETGITVARAHLFTAFSKDVINVTELYVFENPGTSTYIGQDQGDGLREVSRFLLPEGARDIAFREGQMGGRFHAIAGGLIDTEPVWPGTSNVMFSYTVDCPDGDCDLSRQSTLDIPALNVLLPDSAAHVVGESVTFEGQEQTQQGTYANYAVNNVVAGENLQLRVHLPDAAVDGAAPAAPRAAQAGAGSRLPWLLLGFVVVALVLVYPYWKEHVIQEAVEASKQAGGGGKGGRKGRT